ncbi:MAG: NADH-quinone oxidoreductase subunit C [Candidatus Micrarchaeaceae archaeon]
MKAERDALPATLSRMKSAGFDYLVKITAVDYVDHVDAIYLLRNLEASKAEIVEVTLNVSDLWLPSVANVHKSADWYERELSEMFGIEIKDRKAPRLLLEKWDGTEPPLRKSFIWDAPYKTQGEKK